MYDKTTKFHQIVVNIATFKSSQICHNFDIFLICPKKIVYDAEAKIHNILFTKVYITQKLLILV